MTRRTNISKRMVYNYLDALVDRFYKILPIKESEEKSGEDTLKRYIESLRREMLGVRELISYIRDDDRFLALLAILQYFIDNDVDVATVRSDVFRAIGLLKKLQKQYFADEGWDHR